MVHERQPALQKLVVANSYVHKQTCKTPKRYEVTWVLHLCSPMTFESRQPKTRLVNLLTAVAIACVPKQISKTHRKQRQRLRTLLRAVHQPQRCQKRHWLLPPQHLLLKTSGTLLARVLAARILLLMSSRQSVVSLVQTRT